MYNWKLIDSLVSKKYSFEKDTFKVNRHVNPLPARLTSNLRNFVDISNFSKLFSTEYSRTFIPIKNIKENKIDF